MTGRGVRRSGGLRRLMVAALLSAGALLGWVPLAHAQCTGGALGVAAPATLTFPATTLSGSNQTLTTTLSLTAHDRSGTGSGWKITGTSTTLTTGTHSLATTATRITAAARTAAAGNCTVRPNSVGYPVTLPAGSTPPAAATLVNATNGAFSGTGPVNIDLTAEISVPGNARAGTYTSTWALTIATGP